MASRLRNTWRTKNRPKTLKEEGGVSRNFLLTKHKQLHTVAVVIYPVAFSLFETISCHYRWWSPIYLYSWSGVIVDINPN